MSAEINREPSRKELSELQIRRLARTLLKPHSRVPYVGESIDDYNFDELSVPTAYQPQYVRAARFDDGGALVFSGPDYDDDSPVAFHHLFTARGKHTGPFAVRYTRHDFNKDGRIGDLPRYNAEDVKAMIGIPTFDDALSLALDKLALIKAGPLLPSTDANRQHFERLKPTPEESPEHETL